MKDWRKTLITPVTPIIEAIKIIDGGALQVALVIDQHSRLIGIVTDGDVRRALLKNLSLDRQVHTIMNKNFITANVNSSREHIIKLMKEKDLRHIPLTDDQGQIVDLKILYDMIELSERKNFIVLMAGGLGTRLQPLTNDCPKPLLKIGGKPLLETIMENFVEYGFKKFFISVNYKAEMIETYLGDGSKWGVDIKYLHEKKKMGTAGSLTLLPDIPLDPIIVMNGDVLTKINFQQLLDFHISHCAKATICVRDYLFQFPYGVVKIDQHRLIAIDEKPVQNFFVNAGIYVIEPDILKLIPPSTPYDMTTLFEDIIAEGYETAVFPLREYWIDIGKIDDLKKAKGDFGEIFQ